MATISQLKRERRLPDEELDEVIARAARLQDRARAEAAGLTVADVKEVGQELDIDPRFVDEALADLKQEREQQALAAGRARRRRWTIAGVGAALVAAAVLVAWSGAGPARAAQARAESAGAALTSVLERQRRLVPQLLVLSGAPASAFAPQLRRLTTAQDLAQRAALADELSEAINGALAGLPAPRDPAQSQMRLSLQHELSGAQNRIAVEQRRYQEALAAWRAASRGPAARLGIALGLASAPE